MDQFSGKCGFEYVIYSLRDQSKKLKSIHKCVERFENLYSA